MLPIAATTYQGAQQAILGESLSSNMGGGHSAARIEGPGTAELKAERA